MLIKGFLGLSCILFLAGCFPVYEDKYTFIPPEENEARICANNCVKERSSCFQKCMQKGVILDLGNKFISAFEQNQGEGNNATKECNNVCREAHTICHRNCGGQVVIEKVCIAFCKGKKKQM